MSQQNDELTPVFVPALITVLISAEDQKGSPLEYEEVIEIRDNGSCIMMELKDEQALTESRGYADINPENCWFEWQMARRELNRKPDLDPGPSFAQIQGSDLEYQQTIQDAKNTLDVFRKMLPQNGDSMFDASVKIKIVDGDASSYMWLFNTRMSGDNFVAELYDVPRNFKSINSGDVFDVNPDDLLDWMVNLEGTLYGGYSIRYHRSKLSADEVEDFDDHVGIIKYA